MPESVVTVNLEADYPTVEEARQLLKAELEKCSKSEGYRRQDHPRVRFPAVSVARCVQGIRKSLINRRKKAA